MSTTIREEAGAIRIALAGGGVARLFGVPFLAAGIWFGYYLVLGLASFATGESGAEMIPGTILLVVMTAAFFLPGWMLVASRAVVEIDRGRDLVTVVRDLRFYRHRHERRLSEFSTIEVDLLSTAPNKHTSRAFQVELTAESRKNQVVGLFDDGEAAVRYGQRLGELVGLPLVDKRFTESPSDE